MRYYHAEHEDAYRRIRRLGYTHWNDLFGESTTFEQFGNRAFLDDVLPRLGPAAPAQTTVFEYGCGTGPAACHLAALGYRVTAVDLVADAVALAREFAAARDLVVRFEVGDICASTALPDERYDIVLDSYCLQSIVTDTDRAAVYAAVRDRLAPGGRYLISTALYRPGDDADPDQPYDPQSGIRYRLAASDAEREQLKDVVIIDGRRFVPSRRHLTAAALCAELDRAGFTILDLGRPDEGHLVCARTGDG